MYVLDRRHRNTILGRKPRNIKTFDFMIFMDETKKVDFITDKWISLRTSGFVNLLVRRTSRFFDEIRALIYYCV